VKFNAQKVQSKWSSKIAVFILSVVYPKPD
jgi:hypothetical protein